MKHRSKLTQRQEHEEEQQAHTGADTQFSNSDELLRFDAAQTAVPPEIARRLEKSAAQIRQADSRPWWKRLLER